MAVIPLSDQVSASRVQGDRLQTAPSGMLSGPGEALQQLGSAISSAVEKHNAEQKKMDEYKANVSLEQWSTNQTIEYQNDLNNSAPDGSDFIQRRDKALVDSYSKVRDTITDEDTRKRADLVFEKFRGNQVVSGFNDVDKKRTQYVTDTTDKAIQDAISTGAVKSDTDYNGYYKSIIEPRITQYVSDPAQQAKLKELFGKKMAGAFMDLNPRFAAPKNVPVVAPAAKDKVDGMKSAIISNAEKYGYNALDVATLISYETGGTFDDWKAGPTTRWGQHRGLIQWGEPQRAKYGIYKGMPVGEQINKVFEYLHDAGVRPGMTRTQMYAAINGGHVSKVNASDAAAGGAPGTVAEKVAYQMAGHEKKAAALLGGTYTPTMVSYVATPQPKPTGGMWDYVGYDEWNRYSAEGERYMKSQMAEAKAQLQQNLSDYYSSLRMGGRSDINEPTIADFASALGDEADAAFSEHIKNRQLALDEHALSDKSTGQIMTLLEQRKAEASTGSGAAADEQRLATLESAANPILKERARSIEAQQSEQMKQFAEAKKAEIASKKAKIDAFQDDVLTVTELGKTYNGWSPTLQDYIDVYGEEAGSLLFSKTGTFITAAKDAAKFGTASITQIKSALAQYKEDITSGAGAKDAAVRYDAMQKAAQNVMAARETDIAGYVQEKFPEVNKFFDTYLKSGGADDASLAQGYKMMNDIQAQLGVPEEKRKLLPKAVAENAVSKFFDIEETSDKRMDAVSGLVFGSGSDGFNKQIAAQLIEAGLPRSSIAALAAFERGDRQASSRLFDAAMIKKDADKLVKLSEPDKRARDQQINDEMLSPNGRGYVTYGLDSGSQSSFEQLKADRDLMERAIDIRMAKGEDVNTATKGALDDLFGATVRKTGQTRSGINYDVILQGDDDPGTLSAGFSAIAPQVRSSLEALDKTMTEDAISGLAPPRGTFADKKPAGLVEPGNIDLYSRPIVKNADGSISTVRSASFNIDGKEVLIPTVSNDGKLLSDTEALQQYEKTGKHLGKFDTPANATAYAEALHADQASYYGKKQQMQDSARATLSVQNANTINMIMANGYFKSVDDKFGFFNPYNGKFVGGPDGKPLLFSRDDVNGAANGATDTMTTGESWLAPFLAIPPIWRGNPINPLGRKKSVLP